MNAEQILLIVMTTILIGLGAVTNQTTSSLDDFLIVDDFKKYAEKYMEKVRLSYIQSGSMLEQTLDENTEAFRRLRFQPKLLRNTVNMDLSTTILGTSVPSPIGVCPNALQQVVHPHGENATARAVAAEGTVMILSADSSLSMEEVAASAPSCHRWFQVLNYKNSSITEDMLRRAKKAGYKAIVLTADFPVESKRITYLRTKFSYGDYRAGNYDKYKSSTHFEESIEPEPSLTWKNIYWLKDVSRLPLVVKGVLTAHDAKLAVENGADAIIVSTHGGRQLDGVPASIEALPEVVRAVNGRVEVYLDSGVRTGSDVVKALAIGARAVFIGRPNLYGLYVAGEQGSRKVLQLLTSEMKNVMHLIGASNINDLNLSYLKKEEFYRRPLY